MTASRLEVHLYLPQLRLDLDQVVARARAAEAAGFDGLALMDHLAPPLAEDQPMFEALSLALWLAAHTDRLTLGHLVLCDGVRAPAVLARQVVALDQASAGRFELGIGAGSTPAELGRFGLGAPPARSERVARLGETLAVLRGLWSGEPFSFAGRFHRLEEAQQRPVPTRPIPVVIGGSGADVLALAASSAQWWNLPAHHHDRLDRLRPASLPARTSVQLVVTFTRRGADRAEVEGLADRRYGWMSPAGRVAGTGPELVERLGALAAGGVERLYLWFTDFAPPDTLAAFGQEVLAELR